MKLQRAIGQTSQILNLFVQDTTVSTGAGLANIPATTVSYTWFHNNQAAASTGVAVSTASMGAYTSGAWTQISSSLALGWYQFGLPDGALAIGDAVGVHIYVSTGAFAMAPLPIEIELVRDNPQQFSSSKVFLAYTSTSPSNITQIQGQNAVTSASGTLTVSTQAVDKTGYIVNVSSWANSTVVATSTGVVDVNLVNIWNKSAATSGSGILTVSTQAVDKTGYIVNVSSWANSTVVATSSGVVDVNLVNIWNKSAVTSGSGTLIVSTQAVDKTGYLVNVTSFSATITTNANVIQAYGSAIVTSASGQFRVSTQSLVGIVVSTQTIDKTGYDVTTFYGSAAVTSGSGILNVSTQTLPAAGAGDITTIYGQPIVTSAAGIMDINVKNIVNSPAVTSAAGKLVVSTQSLVGIVVSTQAIDKGGYGVTTNADKTGYTLTAADKAGIMAVISTTTISESYRASSDIASIPQLMYEMLANVTDFANSGTTRALNSVTSHATGTLQYQYDSTTPSSITRIA